MFENGNTLENETHWQSAQESAFIEKIGRNKFHTKLLTVT
jgi:hypothetical protein